MPSDPALSLDDWLDQLASRTQTGLELTRRNLPNSERSRAVLFSLCSEDEGEKSREYRVYVATGPSHQKVDLTLMVCGNAASFAKHLRVFNFLYSPAEIVTNEAANQIAPAPSEFGTAKENTETSGKTEMHPHFYNNNSSLDPRNSPRMGTRTPPPRLGTRTPPPRRVNSPAPMEDSIEPFIFSFGNLVQYIQNSGPQVISFSSDIKCGGLALSPMSKWNRIVLPVQSVRDGRAGFAVGPIGHFTNSFVIAMNPVAFPQGPAKYWELIGPRLHQGMEVVNLRTDPYTNSSALSQNGVSALIARVALKKERGPESRVYLIFGFESGVYVVAFICDNEAVREKFVGEFEAAIQKVKFDANVARSTPLVAAPRPAANQKAPLIAPRPVAPPAQMEQQQHNVPPPMYPSGSRNDMNNSGNRHELSQGYPPAKIGPGGPVRNELYVSTLDSARPSRNTSLQPSPNDSSHGSLRKPASQMNLPTSHNTNHSDASSPGSIKRPLSMLSLSGGNTPNMSPRNSVSSSGGTFASIRRPDSIEGLFWALPNYMRISPGGPPVSESLVASLFMTHEGFVTTSFPPPGTLSKLSGQSLKSLVDKGYANSILIGHYNLRKDRGEIVINWMSNNQLRTYRGPTGNPTVGRFVNENNFVFDRSCFVGLTDSISYYRGLPFKDIEMFMDGSYRGYFDSHIFINLRGDGTCDIGFPVILSFFNRNQSVHNWRYQINYFTIEFTSDIGETKAFSIASTAKGRDIWLEGSIFVETSQPAISGTAPQQAIPVQQMPQFVPGQMMQQSMAPQPGIQHPQPFRQGPPPHQPQLQQFAMDPRLMHPQHQQFVDPRFTNVPPPYVTQMSMARGPAPQPATEQVPPLFGLAERITSIEGVFVGVQKDSTMQRWLPLTLMFTHDGTFVYGSVPRRGALSTANGKFVSEQIADVGKPARCLSGKYVMLNQMREISITWDTLDLIPQYQSAKPTRQQSIGRYVKDAIIFHPSEFATCQEFILKRARAFPYTGVCLERKYVNQKNHQHFVHFHANGQMIATDPAVLAVFKTSPQGPLIYSLGHYNLEITSGSEVAAFTVYMPEESDDILMIERTPYLAE